MIEDLTIEKLIIYGFSDENIDCFKTWDNYEMMLHKGLKDVYWASNKEQKIYSGKDAFRKKYFTSDTIVNFPSNEPDLIPEYYKRKQSIFLKKNKDAVGQIFSELKCKERFKQKEIELTKKEIEAANIEIASQHIQVLKKIASSHCLIMENYLDWLTELDVNSIPDKNVTSIAYFPRPIAELEYFNIYVLDDNLMSHYEEHLKKVNPNISLETTINELSAIFSIIEKWNDILLNERHKNAPSKEIATIEFEKELLEIVDQNDENYCNKFRRIAYNLRKKGKPVHLKGLGYLFLQYLCQIVDGEDVIRSISIVFDVKIILEALAEGAAIAEFVHSENFGALNQASSKKIDKINNNQTKKLIDEQFGDLKNICVNPQFNPDHIGTIFDLIKNHFGYEEQSKLRDILETGGYVAEPLIFLDNGNRLADAFKQLFEGDIITGCTKRELEKWISNNFKYRYRQEDKQFTLHYLNDIISTTKDKCKKAILNVTFERTTKKCRITKA